MNKISDKIELKFPCDFPIKIFGKLADDFYDNILNMTNEHFGDYLMAKFNHSKKNSYIAVTVTVEAKSKQQLDNFYRKLKLSTDVVMAL